MASVEVKNVGSSAIINQTIHFGSSIGNDVNILGFGVVPNSHSDPDTVHIKASKSGFDMEIKTLPRDEEHVIWILYSCCEIFSASPMTEGLQVSQKISDYKDDFQDSEDFLWWIAVFIAVVVSFVLGVALDSSVSQTMLKKR